MTQQKINQRYQKSFAVGKSQVRYGNFSYGVEKIKVAQWGEGRDLNIGKFCSFAGGITVFLGGNHRTDWISTYPFGHIHVEVFGSDKVPGHPSSAGDVHIGNDVWVGQSASIVSGVTIGDGAVVAAHTHVCRDVAPYEIVGGNPATHIRYRFDEDIIALLLKLRWWDLDVAAIKELIPTLNTTPSAGMLLELIDKFGRG